MACMKNGRSLSEISMLNSRAMARVTVLDSARQTSQPARSRQCPALDSRFRAKGGDANKTPVAIAAVKRSLVLFFAQHLQRSQNGVQPRAERGHDAGIDRLQWQVDLGKIADIDVAIAETRVARRQRRAAGLQFVARCITER